VERAWAPSEVQGMEPVERGEVAWEVGWRSRTRLNKIPSVDTAYMVVPFVGDAPLRFGKRLNKIPSVDTAYMVVPMVGDAPLRFGTRDKKSFFCGGRGCGGDLSACADGEGGGGELSGWKGRVRGGGL